MIFCILLLILLTSVCLTWLVYIILSRTSENVDCVTEENKKEKLRATITIPAFSSRMLNYLKSEDTSTCKPHYHGSIMLNGKTTEKVSKNESNRFIENSLGEVKKMEENNNENICKRI